MNCIIHEKQITVLNVLEHGASESKLPSHTQFKKTQGKQRRAPGKEQQLSQMTISLQRLLIMLICPTGSVGWLACYWSDRIKFLNPNFLSDEFVFGFSARDTIAPKCDFNAAFRGEHHGLVP
jgi:hypothetical protein